MSKPREFWVKVQVAHNNPEVYWPAEVSSSSFQYGIPGVRQEDIYVIEKSAYDALAEELSETKQHLEEYKGLREIYLQIYSEVKRLHAEGESLKKELHSTKILPDTPELINLRTANVALIEAVKSAKSCCACIRHNSRIDDFILGIDPGLRIQLQHIDATEKLCTETLAKHVKENK